MKVFKPLKGVDAAALPPPLHKACRGTLAALIDAYAEHGQTYNWGDDGYVVLVEEGDADAEFEAECGYPLRDALLEGCVFEDGVRLTCVLHNNQFGISIILLDAPWLDPGVRAKLQTECADGAWP